MPLNQLSASELDLIIQECALAVGPLEFVPGNDRYGEFEKTHLPTSDMQALSLALVQEALRGSLRGRSINYTRTLVTSDRSRNGAQNEDGRLANLVYAQLCANGIEPVNVRVSTQFDLSLGMLVTFSVNGIVIRP